MSGDAGGQLPDDEINRTLRELSGRLEAASQRQQKKAAKTAARVRRRAARRVKLRRSVPWLVTGIVAAAIVATAAILPRLGGSGLGPAPSATAPVAHEAVPRRSPASLEAQPFAGTPAAAYADGATGIVLPPAHRVGRFSAKQVAAAYRMTKRLLVAANLDPRTLRGGSPDAFTKLLTRRQRADFVRGLAKRGADKHGYTRSTRMWVASFAPGTTQLVGDVIKVRGTMSARTATVSGTRVLKIAPVYLFVYPVQQPARPSTLVRVVVRTAPAVEFYRWDDPGGPLEPWWINSGDVSGSHCDVHDGFIHPVFSSGPPDKVHARGPTVHPYQLTRPRSATSCHPTTGT
jgi:hypothetical protein